MSRKAVSPPARPKPQEVADAFPALPAEFTVGDLAVTITQVFAVNNSVFVNGRVTRAGQPVFVNWPVVVVNPPLRAVSAGGVPIDDPAFALAQVVADTIGG